MTAPPMRSVTKPRHIAGIIRGLAAAGLTGALCLVATGCGQTADTDETGDPLASPLSQYLAVVTGYDDPDWRQQRADEQAQLEQFVAQCMADQGFEYVPTIQRVQYTFDRGAQYNPDDPEWVAQWGYGVVRDPVQAAGATNTDPNAKYVAELSDAEQQAYSDALIGNESTGGGGLGPDSPGCYGDAYRDLRDNDPILSDEHASIMAALDAFYATQFDSPDYAEVDADWSSCMADAEYSGFSRQRDAEQSIYSALSITPGDDDSLDGLHQQEVNLALADLDCREDTDYRQRALAVQRTQEEQFITDHRVELDSLVADERALDQ